MRLSDFGLRGSDGMGIGAVVLGGVIWYVGGGRQVRSMGVKLELD